MSIKNDLDFIVILRNFALLNSHGREADSLDFQNIFWGMIAWASLNDKH